MDKITWAYFETHNPDTTTNFEQLCRLMFKRRFFDAGTIFQSSPNQAGIEVNPVFSSTLNKRVSFQSKYVSTPASAYTQLEKSANSIVKHWSGQLDEVYFYVKVDLTPTATGYTKILNILQSANITAKFITNQEILTTVSTLYPDLGSTYFAQKYLSTDWFREQVQLGLDNLGPRYNKDLNVSTDIEERIALFTNPVDAVNSINAKKLQATNLLENLSSSYSPSNNLEVSSISRILGGFGDITLSSIMDSNNWRDILESKCADAFQSLQREQDSKISQLSDSSLAKPQKEQLKRDLSNIQQILTLPKMIEPSATNLSLIQNHCLIITGEAGEGKSQLLATSAQKSIENSSPTILLLGQSFLANTTIAKAIMEHLELDYSFDDLLSVLETLGELNNLPVTIHIDALNESVYRDVWKNGLLSVINKIDKLSFVRIIISVRTGYEENVFNASLIQKITEGSVSLLQHRGFELNIFEAMEIFFKHYKIEFSPSYLFQSEMSNPLFLTLFCKTFQSLNQNEHISIFTLMDAVVQQTFREVKDNVDENLSQSAFNSLLDSIARHIHTHNTNYISEQALLGLECWNLFGISSYKQIILRILDTSGLMIASKSGRSEHYQFSYNLLLDYLSAEYILNMTSDSNTDLREYISTTVLTITQGKVHGDVNLFSIIANLYAERNHEELIDVIDQVTDEYDKSYATQTYVKAIAWRSEKGIAQDTFFDIIRNYPVEKDSVWKVFIAHSLKVEHPLNANTLTDYLMSFPIAQRDFNWTLSVNEITLVENSFSSELDNLYRLVLWISQGKDFIHIPTESVDLLLNLCTWLLSTTNKNVRDTTSKALVELLKHHFNRCLPLLQTFQNVNDPYILQRLYAAVFGASTKRVKEDTDEVDFSELSSFIFEQIFNQPEVYLDILVRDYARLTIEYWVHEYPESQDSYDIQKIHPPYTSSNLHQISPYTFSESYVKDSGKHRIERSMILEEQKTYGDFGRYTFGSTFRQFSGVCLVNLQAHALNIIFCELGYTDDFFAEFDTSHKVNYDRSDGGDFDRIGKKYQWIAFYRLLAIVYDHHAYEGWGHESTYTAHMYELMVRDFDPTLNSHFSTDTSLPEFHEATFQYDWFKEDKPSQELTDEWVKSSSDVFDKHYESVHLTDTNSHEWIALYHYEKQEPFDLMDHRQEIWCMTFAYFVREEDFEKLHLELKDKNFMGRWFPEGYSFHHIYNREAPWSSNYEHASEPSWIDYEIDTGETVSRKYTFPTDSPLSTILATEESDTTDTIEEDTFSYLREFALNIGEMQVPLKRTLCKIIPAHSSLTFEWDHEHRGEDAIGGVNIPCKDLINFFSLSNKTYEGSLYDSNGELVAFDDKLLHTGQSRLLIRKDFLQRYLTEKKLRLFWTSFGEKNYYFDGFGNNFSRGVWSGLFYLDSDKIRGEFSFKEK